jgi:E3 ubiquitin-protein ligase NEDD4
VSINVRPAKYFLTKDGCCSVIRRSSVVNIQIFDERKFKKRDQGLLGVMIITGGDAIDYALGGQGMAALSEPMQVY